MSSLKLSQKIVIAVFLVLLPVSLQAQTDIEFRWTSSATVGESGQPLAEAVRYDVFYQRDSGIEALVASVTDTVFVLNADPGVYHRIRVRGVDKDGRSGQLSPWSDEVYIGDPDRSEGQAPPAGALNPAYPNPFNPETNISYGIPEGVGSGERITLAVYNLKGHRVRTFEPERSSGWHTVVWNGRDDVGRIMPTGQYVTLFTCGDEVTTSKMTMIK